MPYDSEGNFTRDYNWDEDRQNDIDISSDRMDGEFNNYATAMNLCYLRDGRASMQAPIKMGNFQIKQLARGTVANDAVNKEQLDETKTNSKKELLLLLNSIHQIGDIKASIRAENHGNWFLCNGQAVNRVTYSTLFGIIGTKFGAGDGATTFNLPDYRGKFLRGLGGDSESDVYKTQAEGLPNITGQTHAQDGYLRSPNNSGAFKEWKGTSGSARSGDGGSSASYGIFDASASNPIYGASKHVTPINQAVNFFIKVAEEK